VVEDRDVGAPTGGSSGEVVVESILHVVGGDRTPETYNAEAGPRLGLDGWHRSQRLALRLVNDRPHRPETAKSGRRRSLSERFLPDFGEREAQSGAVAQLSRGRRERR